MEPITSELTTIALALIVASIAMLAGTRITRNAGQNHHNLAKLRKQRLDTAAGGVMACGTAALGLTLAGTLVNEAEPVTASIVDATRTLTEIAIAVGACLVIFHLIIWLWWLVAHIIERKTELT